MEIRLPERPKRGDKTAGKGESAEDEKALKGRSRPGRWNIGR